MPKTDNRKQVKKHLVDALEAEECAKKEFHIREALQLLTIEQREIRTTH